MASIHERGNGYRRIQFLDESRKRQNIRLGKVTRRQAEAVRIKVESLMSAKLTGHVPDDETSRWLARIGTTLANELARVGLIPGRDVVVATEFIDGYISSRQDVKPATRRAWRQALRQFTDYFGDARLIKDVSKADAAEWRQSLINQGLSDATVRKYSGYVKQFFAVAVDRDLSTVNPFAKLVSGSIGNERNQYFVTHEETARLIEACPDVEWRLIVALSRFGGLRCPSEHLALRWQDVDWDSELMTVRSPKTEKQGKPCRLVPVFAELRPFLEAAWELAEPGDQFVVTRSRDPNGSYIRKRLAQLVEKAGLKRWPRITHNMRASRQTELERVNPTHVVCAIMGNTPRVAQRHYLQVTHEDLIRAGSIQVVHQAVHHRAESACIVSQEVKTDKRSKSLQSKTVPSVTTVSVSVRGNMKKRKAGVDGNRTCRRNTFRRNGVTPSGEYRWCRIRCNNCQFTR